MSRFIKKRLKKVGLPPGTLVHAALPQFQWIEDEISS